MFPGPTTLAEICENIGADWSEIVPALRLDKRIGQYSYLKPGLGIAGGNLERDLNTVLNYAEEHQTDGGVVSAWVANSKHRKDWAYKTLNELVLQKQNSPKKQRKPEQHEERKAGKGKSRRRRKEKEREEEKKERV